MAQKQFVILDNKDLALINGTTGLTKLEFTADSVSNTQTITFITTNPCVAILDNDGVQWDLNSKRVWYTGTNVTIDLTDILYAKGLITTPATITTITGTYKRDKATDTDSGYSWILDEQAPGASNVPLLLYTKAESPVVGDPAYYVGSASGASMDIRQVTKAVAAPIEGTWYAVFTVSTASGGGSGGVVGAGIEYDVITD